ncbi:WD40 repeat-like protein [Eremomyces bilateralis CBS 781.70]|uniref:WD40 repeat-like protein n=1 Tax=Eremomyces bilateralis CBS 781.70 TaxID=1392243 RepID=A0A6G1G6I5_9PEZI|nr:WD40 repeat-like protein [Eremomyces bilateralis CBS 781.70]KAF1813705.1 WD40 repeat-like protein [Eremomyces bilateralis CBS 781.70]
MHPSRQAFVEDDPPSPPGLSLSEIPTDRDYNISTAGGTVQTSALLEQFNRKRLAARLVVPTDDKRVRLRLRELGEPITLFGEGLADRRERLRELLVEAELGEEGDVVMGEAGDGLVGEEALEEEEQEEEFYTEGSEELQKVRREIARYSLPRAARRVGFQKVEAGIAVRTHVRHRRELKEKLARFELVGSQIGGDRPIAVTKFAPNDRLIAIGSWGGSVKVLDRDTLSEKKVLRGHTDRIGGIAWNPNVPDPDPDTSLDTLTLASGAGDANIHLWSLASDTPIGTLSGHSARVCRVEFHPSSRFLASASYDTTWRLWDVTTTQELQLQEGHSREVYTVAFNSDGSLLASGGLDSIGRIWDLRTGRTVMLLDGHIQPVYALDWAVDAHRVLSGSADGFVKCWDLRAVREVGAIGAHTGGVTDLKVFKGTDGPASGVPLTMGVGEKGGEEPRPKKAGSFFVSCGFDRNVKVFSADDWALGRTLSGHAGNVLGVDVSTDGRWITSCGYDRTVKLWEMEGVEEY